MTNDAAVAELDLAVRLLLEGQSVLHPVIVVTVGIILASVGAARFFPVGSGDGGLCSAC